MLAGAKRRRVALRASLRVEFPSEFHVETRRSAAEALAPERSGGAQACFYLLAVAKRRR
jgi:hypothetical protein